jgi:hypothetical protein
VTGFANTGIRIFRMTYLLKKVPNYLMGPRQQRVYAYQHVHAHPVQPPVQPGLLYHGTHITMPFLIIGVYVIGSAMIIMLVTGRFSAVGSKQLAVSGN